MKRLLITCLIMIGLLAGCKTTQITVNTNAELTSEFGRRLSEHAIVEDGVLIVSLDSVYASSQKNFNNDLLYARKHGIKKLTIRMSNPGGGVFNMLYFIDLVHRAKECGIFVRTVAEGYVMSAAVPIFMLGDYRVISPRSYIMIHPLQGVGDVTKLNLDTQNMLTRVENIYADVVSSRSSLSREFVWEMMHPLTEVRDYDKGYEKDENGKLPMKTVIDRNAMFWFTAEEALKLKMADEIKTCL